MAVLVSDVEADDDGCKHVVPRSRKPVAQQAVNWVVTHLVEQSPRAMCLVLRAVCKQLIAAYQKVVGYTSDVLHARGPSASGLAHFKAVLATLVSCSWQFRASWQLKSLAWAMDATLLGGRLRCATSLVHKLETQSALYAQDLAPLQQLIVHRALFHEDMLFNSP